MMTMDLKSMAVEMPEVAGHPNRTAFQGVLTMVDVPSQRSPSGAKGRLVVLTRNAAEAALPSLLGMAVDYSPTLDRHDVRCKVGVITRAEIVGRNLEVGGYLYARDFPEIVEEIAKSEGLSGRRSLAASREKIRHRSERDASGSLDQPGGVGELNLRSSLRMAAVQLLNFGQMLSVKKRVETLEWPIRAESSAATGGKGLGMSYEVTQVELADRSSAIWVLNKVTFTGAAILRRDKAAYKDTWIELKQ
jgi:hypothetical protein